MIFYITSHTTNHIFGNTRKNIRGVFCQIAWSRGKYDDETTKKMAEKLHTGDLHLFGVINNIPEICETVHTRLMNIKNNIDKKIRRTCQNLILLKSNRYKI